MSIKDPAHLELLKALQPIVFQTPLDSAPLLQQSKFSQVSVNSELIVLLLLSLLLSVTLWISGNGSAKNIITVEVFMCIVYWITTGFFFFIIIIVFLTGQTSSELAQEAITQMHRLQDLPIFKPVGVI